MKFEDYHAGISICFVAIVVVSLIIYLINRSARPRDAVFFEEPSCAGLWWMKQGRQEWRLVLVESIIPLTVRDAATKDELTIKDATWAICTNNTPPNASPK